MASNPVDPGYAERVRASFARQSAMDTIGARLLEVEPGRVVIELAHRDSLTQQHGFIHAGIVATALDSACGYAAATLMPADAGVLTIEFKINLLAPARGPVLRLEGLVTKAGRTITVADGRAWQPHPSKAGEQQLMATMSATLMTVTGRDNVRH
ncbi:MAG: PaaI family thioesterase [Leptothrix sp. (in: b-proteobacteria)]